MKLRIGIITIVLLLFVFRSHFEHNELHNVAFISAIGLDLTKKGYQLSVQVINPLAFTQQGQNSLPFYVFEQEGHSLNNVMSKLSQNISRKVDVSHVQTIIISEKAAKDQGINKGITNMIRAAKYPYDTIVLITKKYKAKEFLEALPFFELVTSREIASHLDNISEERGSAFPVYLTNLQQNILKEGKDAIIPTIDFKGNLKVSKTKIAQGISDASTKNIYFNGLELLKNAFPVEWIDSSLSPTFYLLNNKIVKTNINTSCGEKKNVSFILQKSHTKIKGKLVNDIPTFTISTKIRGNIADYTCDYDLNSIKNGHKIEKLLETKIKKDILKLINTTQKSQSDIVGFGEILDIYDNKNWKKIKKDWSKLYLKSQIDVEIDVIIQNYGDLI